MVKHFFSQVKPHEGVTIEIANHISIANFKVPLMTLSKMQSLSLSTYTLNEFIDYAESGSNYTWDLIPIEQIF